MSDTVALPRHLIAEMFPNNARAVAAFEALIQQITQTSFDGAETSDTASALQNATFVTLSANDVLANERVLEVGPGLSLDTSGGRAKLDTAAKNFAVSGPGSLTVVIPTSVTVVAPSSGLMAIGEAIALGGSYANDAAAAAGGVPVHGFYRNGNAVMVRLA
jgi:hypothetical protein